MLILTNNQRLKKHSVIQLILLFIFLSSMATDVCIAMQSTETGPSETGVFPMPPPGARTETDDDLYSSEATVIPMRPGASGTSAEASGSYSSSSSADAAVISVKQEANEHGSSVDLDSIVIKDKKALSEGIPNPKGLRFLADRVVFYVTGKNPLEGENNDHPSSPHQKPSSGSVVKKGIELLGSLGTYSDELKALTSWIWFMTFLMENKLKDAGPFIRNMAVRPKFRFAAADHHPPPPNHDGRHQPEAVVEPGDDLVKMVNMMKNGKVTNLWEDRKEMAAKVFSRYRGAGEQPDSPKSPGGGSSTNAKWTNEGVCKQVSKLVEMLKDGDKKLEEHPNHGNVGHQDHVLSTVNRQNLINLLTNIFTHHKDVLAGKHDAFPDGHVKTDVEEWTSGKLSKLASKAKTQVESRLVNMVNSKLPENWQGLLKKSLSPRNTHGKEEAAASNWVMNRDG